MTEHVLQFLQYGAPAERIGSLVSTVTAPFLPSLALAASDSPALIPHLLPSLYSFREVRGALVYAALDYVEIAQAVLEAEAETEVERVAGVAAAAEKVATAGVDDGAAAGVEHEDEGGEEWPGVNEDEIDECNAFEVADEVRFSRA